jgi:hypothetical protein
MLIAQTPWDSSIHMAIRLAAISISLLCCEQARYFGDAYTIVSANARTLQHSQSVMCDHYCLLFLCFCARVALSGSNKVSAMQFLVMLTNPRSGGSDKAARNALALPSLRELFRGGDTLAPALRRSLKFGALK